MLWDHKVLSCLAEKCGMDPKYLFFLLLYNIRNIFSNIAYECWISVGSSLAPILIVCICMRLVLKKIVLQKMRSYLHTQGNINLCTCSSVFPSHNFALFISFIILWN